MKKERKGAGDEGDATVDGGDLLRCCWASPSTCEDEKENTFQTFATSLCRWTGESSKAIWRTTFT